MGASLLISSYPDRDTAIRAAKDAVESRLAACVSVSQTHSIYRWKGKVEETPEFLAFFKTTADGAEALREFIAGSHPYDTPEILGIPPGSVNESYMEWLDESVLSGGKPQ